MTALGYSCHTNLYHFQVWDRSLMGSGQIDFDRNIIVIHPSYARDGIVLRSVAVPAAHTSIRSQRRGASRQAGVGGPGPTADMGRKRYILVAWTPLLRTCWHNVFFILFVRVGVRRGGG